MSSTEPEPAQSQTGDGDAAEPAAEPTPEGAGIEDGDRTEPPAPGGSARHVLGLLVAVLLAGLIGGGLGAFLMHRMNSEPASAPAPVEPPGPTEADVRAATVRLCTGYASINRSMPNPIQSPLQVLVGINSLRWALADNPDASAEVRDAIQKVVNNYDGLVASNVRIPPGPLTEPPPYDAVTSQQAVDRVLVVCRLTP